MWVMFKRKKKNTICHFDWLTIMEAEDVGEKLFVV